MLNDIELLKEILAVPTYSQKENEIILYLTNWLNINNYNHYIDKYGNIYITKNENNDLKDFYYPCVVAHTDTVHYLDSINIREEMLPDCDGNIKLALKAYNDYGYPTGIGGDDKCGIYACLKLLEELPTIKVAFFVSEEIGCLGSKVADDNFFKDVGYVIQFDAPENWMITQFCFGVELFINNGEFHTIIDKVLTKNMSNRKEYQRHPYTDVYALKQKYNFACLNISIGYYDYHSNVEYVIVDDTFNGVKIGKELITSLKYNRYY